MVRACLVILFATACGARTELSSSSFEAGPTDAGVDHVADAGPKVEVLATGKPWAIAVDDANAYWTDLGVTKKNSSGILACSIHGCGGVPSVVASVEFLWNLPKAHSLAVNATNLFWMANGDVVTCPKKSCGAPTVLATMGNDLAGIAADDANVFWTYGGDQPTGGSVFTCSETGCGAQPSAFAAHQSGPGDISLAGGEVYWANFNAIMKCPASGCANPTALVSVPFLPQSIAASTSGVWWSRTNAIEGCASSGCGAPSTVAADPTPSVIATDGTSVYWAEPGALMKCPVSGCGSNPTTLATFAGVVGGIAVDATSVYWTTNPGQNQLGQGQVMKLTPK